MDQEAAALAVLAKRSFDRTTAEVQQLAAWLVSHSPFFSSMRTDVVEHLCAHIGHAWVPESQPVYSQGQVGDCMYIIVKGYCSILKHASTAAGSTDGTSSSSSTSRGSTLSHPASRRATMELQTQQFALATGAVGTSTAALGCRRGTTELAARASSLHLAGSAMLSGGLSVASGSSTVASRRVTGGFGPAQAAAGSRRVTAEQMVQQQLAESTQLGWLGRGDSFGEAALVNATQQRPVSVAGDEGVTLLVLDRACFNRLQQQAQAGAALAAAAAQAVLAAACRPILRVGGLARTAEEVETLAELFSGLEAFRCMPRPVRNRLAKACQGLQLPPGAVVFEEDEQGDAMYVVVSGCLQVRARPLQASAGPPQQQLEGMSAGQSGPGQASSTPGGDAAAAAASGLGQPSGSAAAGAAGSLSGVVGGAEQGMRATVDAVAGSSGLSGSGTGGRGLRQPGGSRRTTWEGAAFTAKEQSKLDAVRTALESERQEAAAAVSSDSGSRAAQGNNLVERDGLYWTAKFMADATAAATACEPQWGLEGGMTPLAAVFTSKWRQQVRQQSMQHHAQTAAAEEDAADSKAYAAMEEMLGKAAAKAWKAARDNAANLAADAANSSSSSSSPVGVTLPKPAGSVPAAADDAAVAAATVVAGGSGAASAAGPASAAASTPDSPSSSSSSSSSSSAAAAAAAAAVVIEGASEQASSEPTPCTPRTAAAAAAQLLAAAAASSDPVEAVKLHLAALGVKDPADVSRTLMAEIGARASLEGLLVAVAGFLERKGLPARLSRKGSLKITRELNKRMLAGASCKGFGGSSSHSSSFNQHGQEQGPDTGAAADASVTPHCKAGRSRSARASGDGGDFLTAEATGLSSSCDWQSSLDASDAASLGGALGQEDSLAEADGLLMDSMDLPAASTEGAPFHRRDPALPAGALLQRGCGCSCHTQAQTSCSLPSGADASGGVVSCGCQCCTGSAPGQEPQQQLPALQLPAGCAASTQGGGAGAAAAAGCYTARFGPVIRALGTGDSFGELALLQSSAVRTATVVVAPDSAAGVDGQQDPARGAGSSAALLIKISRSCYDATVRALQVAALEELLGLLAGLPPFSGLSREVLTSLAVFIRPVTAQPGQVLALAGQQADALLIVQSGEVKLLAPSSGSTGSAGTSPALTRSISGNGSSSSGGSNAAVSTTGAAAAQQPRSRRTTGTQPTAAGAGGAAAVQARQLSQTGSFNSSSNGNSSLDGSVGTGLGLGAQLTPQQQLTGVQLAMLGPGSLLGENVLGYDPDEDPVAAVTAANSRRARQAANAAAAALTHHATAVAASPCKLLLLAVEDLRRFGRRVRAPLAEAAALRREWLQQRIAAVQVPTMSVGGNSSSSSSSSRGQGGAARAGTEATALPPTHGLCRGSGGGLWQGTASGRSSGSSSGGGGGSGGLWPGLAGLLAPQGSCSAAAAAKMQQSSPGAAAAASRYQYQQQQWQQGAYGELLSRPAAAAQVQQQQQQLSAGDVARLKQVVPAMQAPCVSELAAAARPFPTGMLTASAVAAAGQDGAKGLQLLLAEQHLGDVAGVGSPKWAVGPGGRVLPAGAAAGHIGPASGRRGALSKHLELDN